MAVITKTMKVTGSPTRETLTDLAPGTTRKTIYNFGPFFWGTIVGGGVALLTTGVGRTVLGLNPKNESRDWLEQQLLLAKLNHDNAAVALLNEQRKVLQADPRARTPEEREEQRAYIQATQPLTLAQQEIKTESMEQQLDLQDRLVPIIAEANRVRLETERDLREQRQQAFEDYLQTQDALRERAAAETQRITAEAEQRALNTSLIETAIGGLDYFSKQIFLRDRLFPPPPAARAEPALLRQTTITSY